jgi:hypothetical protein
MINAATVSTVGRERQHRGGDFVTSSVRFWAPAARQTPSDRVWTIRITALTMSRYFFISCTVNRQDESRRCRRRNLFLRHARYSKSLSHLTASHA